jgi:hypothetical protein
MPLPSALRGAILVLLGMPLAASAAEWSAQPKVRLVTGYDDNFRLVSSDHTPVWETSLAPAITLGVATPTSGLSADAGLNIRRYTGGSGLDSGSVLNREDYHLNTDLYHQTLRNAFRLDVNYTRDSTLDSQLDNGVITTGLATREQLLEKPSWTSLLTPRTRMDLGLQNSTIRYTNGIGTTNLIDYDYRTATGSLSYQFTPLTQGLLSVGYSNYLPANGYDSTTYSLQAGFEVKFSETLTTSIQAGERWTTSHTQTLTGFCVEADPGAGFPDCTGGKAVPVGYAKVTVDTTSAVYSASLTKTLEAGSISASLSRSSSPGSNGDLLDATSLGITCNYNSTETVESSLKIQYSQNQTIAGRNGQLDLQNKTFLRVTPRVTWNWLREWSLSGEYQYAEVGRGTGGTATRNAIYVTLIYHPLKSALSR